MRTRTSAPIILAVLVAATGAASPAARAADDCLAAPNGTAPQSSHWYYRVDRATHRKCWYLGQQGAKRRRAVAATAPAATQPVAPAAPVSDAAAAELPVTAPTPSQPAGGGTVPDAGFASRWPRAAQAEAIAGAPPATPGAERIATRSVPTTAERAPAVPARAEPARAAPAPPEPAGEPAAAGFAHQASGLPAALAGVALLLALVGAMLVRAGRRTVARHDPDDRRSPDARIGEMFARIRRGLGEVPAQAGGGNILAQSLLKHPPPLTPPRHALRARGEGNRETDAKGAPLLPPAGDIAAATLQPDIAPLGPAAIDAAPDVEQSLRQLLQAWERRAA